MSKDDMRLSLGYALKQAAKSKAQRHGTNVTAEVRDFLKNDFLGDGVDLEEVMIEDG